MNNKQLLTEEELLNKLTGRALINYILNSNFSNDEAIIDTYYDKISTTIKNEHIRYTANDILNLTNTKLQDLIINNLQDYNAISLILSKEISTDEYLLTKIINANKEKIITLLESDSYYVGRIDLSNIKFTFVEDIILSSIHHEKIFDLLTNPTISPRLKTRIEKEKEQDINQALANEDHYPNQFLLLSPSLQDKIINSLNQYNIIDYVFHPLLINNEEFITKVLDRKEKEIINELTKSGNIEPDIFQNITNSKLQTILINSLNQRNVLSFIFSDNLPEEVKTYILENKSTEVTTALKRLLTSNTLNQKSILFSYIQEEFPKNLDEKITEVLKSIHPKFSPDKRDDLITEEEIVEEINNRITKNINISTNTNLKNLLKNKFNLKNYQSKELLNMLPYFKGDKLTLIRNYDKIEKFLLSNTDIEKFYQYALNIDYDYISAILNVIPQKEEFKKVKTYLEDNIYPQTNTHRVLIENFINIIKNYNRYQELCLNIVSSKEPLTEEVKTNILYLFNLETTSLKNKPKTIHDCLNINIKIKEELIKKLTNTDKLDILELKNIICQILFNDNFNNLQAKLSTYGNTEEMIKLQFNNRQHEDIISLARTMEIYTSLIEEIVSCNNKNDLINLCQNILNNFEQVSNLFTTKINYDEQMQKLYSMETETNLTKINDNASYNSVINKELTKEYGVETYDFFDKEYFLLAHTINEDVTNYLDIIIGYSSGEQNFISLVPISYRNQVYYGRGAGIILGYDTMPMENFVCSSTINLGSNSAIEKNSSQIKSQFREQRGILETSDPQIGNAEILCFREGLKPKYIILPNGRKPYELEISLAKESHLKFVITQELEKSIKNPKPIPHDLIKTSKQKQDITELTKLKDQLLANFKSNNQPRKIAIIADPHALFEPTLAILEDIRKKGITEIYSLGDNIGTGPNPSEVLELLDKYNVKSISGNHELYITKGIDTFKEHLEKTSSYQSSSNNSNWTKDQLTSKQINNLKLYPKTIELTLGGKRILLCHSVVGFNNEKLIINPKDYDRIFQGHIHFRKIGKSNIETLRGVGIGYRNQDLNKAYYLILTEKPKGGFGIEEKFVPFDIDNLKSSINISTLSENDKEKITRWSSPGRKW